MVAHLIGPKKWINLAKELNIYSEEEFENRIMTLQDKYSQTPHQVFACLTHWRLVHGKSATISKLTEVLDSVNLQWLASRCTILLLYIIFVYHFQ